MIAPSKLSGPFVDRMDLGVTLSRLTRSELLGPPQGDTSAVIRSRVQAARRIQSERWGSSSTNASVGAGSFRSGVALTPEARTKLGEAIDGLALTGRGVDRLLRVARTLADLSGDSRVTAKHLGHALGFRLQAGNLVVAA